MSDSQRRKRLLALAVHPISAAATRYRVEGLREPLAERGIDLTIATSLDEKALSALYRPGNFSTKALLAARAGLSQWQQALRKGPWDGVFVQREAALVGPPMLEWLLQSVRGLPLFFDFDDAIWLPTSTASRNPLAARLLKFPQKTWWLMRRASHVFAGSEYLADVARKYNPNVTVVPTVVSRERWQPLPGRLDGDFVHPDEPVIGFVGTHTTAQYLHLVVPALQRLRAEGRRFRLRIVGAGPDLELPIEHERVPWSLEREVQLFQELDIGLAPLPNTEWARGKCAFKQLQYMSLGVPCVTSPIGVTADLTKCGFALAATSPHDWYVALSQLLDEYSLRARLARAGRHATENWLSSEIQAPRVAQIISNSISTNNAQPTSDPIQCHTHARPSSRSSFPRTTEPRPSDGALRAFLRRHGTILS